MKRLIAMVIMVCMAVPMIAFGEPVNTDPVNSIGFKTINCDVPLDVKDNDTWRLEARYADTKEPIALSARYENKIWATVPSENKDRRIEGYIPEEIKFADDVNDDYEFYVMEKMAQAGVIMGNQNNEAKPFDNVTRAEATAMIMRFMGWGNDPSANGIVTYKDVAKEDWFYSVVMSAYKQGIINGDSDDTFAPERNVSREEIMAMLARALQVAGLNCGKYTAIVAQDEDEVSDWAKPYYDYLNSCRISDHEYTYDDFGVEEMIVYCKPQQAATRYEVAELLDRTITSCQIYPSQLSVDWGFDKVMPIIDGSTSTYPFTTSVYEKLFYGAACHHRRPENHSKSHASYQRLINGEVDMLFASVYPASDILALAEEKGVELELIPIAYDAMIFFTNKDNPIAGLTKEQISEIYVNNAYENWSQLGGSDALLYPYCRNNDSGSHAQMEKHFLNGSEINETIRKETTSVSMSNVLTDVMSAQTGDPVGYGLGYSIYYYFQNMDMFYDTNRNLKLLAIDGVFPTDETIADGTYPLANNTYVVLRKDTPADAPARKMAEFMLTEAGQQCVEMAGYGRFVSNKTFGDKLNEHMPIDENYMFSPTSIKIALAMAASGAEDETQQEILDALGAETMSYLNPECKRLIDAYAEVEGVDIDIANSIWVNKSQTPSDFTEEFKADTEDYFNAPAQQVNNSNAVEEINQWVSEKTNGKIPTIIDNSDFMAALINAVYFNAEWRVPFNEKATAPDEFTNADGSKAITDFMHNVDYYQYAAMQDMEIIRIPYKSVTGAKSSFNMYIVTGDNVNVEETLNEAFHHLSLRDEYIDLSMPKFKAEYTKELSDVLKDMGINKAFAADAQFDKMLEGGGVWIDSVLHKTYISVDEKGTEAAAATGAGMGGGSAVILPEPITVKLDKPFYFVIRDDFNGENIFIGRYAFAE